MQPRVTELLHGYTQKLLRLWTCRRHPKSLRCAPGRKVLPNGPAQALISAPCMSANCLERFSSLVSLSIEKSMMALTVAGSNTSDGIDLFSLLLSLLASVLNS